MSITNLIVYYATKLFSMNKFLLHIKTVKQKHFVIFNFFFFSFIDIIYSIGYGNRQSLSAFVVQCAQPKYRLPQNNPSAVVRYTERYKIFGLLQCSTDFAESVFAASEDYQIFQE